MKILEFVHSIHQKKMLRHYAVTIVSTAGLIGCTTLVSLPFLYWNELLALAIFCGLSSIFLYILSRSNLFVRPDKFKTCAELDLFLNSKERVSTLFQTSTSTEKETEALLIEKQLTLICNGKDLESYKFAPLPTSTKLLFFAVPIIWSLNIFLFKIIQNELHPKALVEALAIEDLVNKEEGLPEAVKDSLRKLSETLKSNELSNAEVTQALKNAQDEVALALEELEIESTDEEIESAVEPESAEPEPSPTIDKQNEKEDEKDKAENQNSQESKQQKSEDQEENSADKNQEKNSQEKSEDQKKQSSSAQQGQKKQQDDQKGDGDGQGSGSGSNQGEGKDGKQGQSGNSSGTEKQQDSKNQEGQQGQKENSKTESGKGGQSGNSSQQEQSLNNAQQALAKIGEKQKQEQKGDGTNKNDNKDKQQSGKDNSSNKDQKNNSEKNDQQEKGQSSGSNKEESKKSEQQKMGEGDSSKETQSGKEGEQNQQSEEKNKEEKGQSQGSDAKDSKPAPDQNSPTERDADKDGNSKNQSIPSLSQSEREAKRFGDEPSDEEGLAGQKKAFQDVKIGTENEKLDPKFLSKNSKLDQNSNKAKYKTDLKEVELAQPDASSNKESQQIPFEYKDLLD